MLAGFFYDVWYLSSNRHRAKGNHKMKNYFKSFTGKIKYPIKQNEFIFELDENADLTDEIEKSLLEIKRTLNIPDSEIDAAIRSRKLSKK